jgi:hypothetical protein
MNTFLRALCAFSVLGSIAAGTAPALAQDRNILIVGEDADEDSVPRFSRIFGRVLVALTEELGEAGFEVVDETAASLGNFYEDRVRWTDAELVELAASVRGSPIALVLSVNIFATSDEQRYFTRVRTRVEGRLISTETGHRFGAVEIEGPRSWNAPFDCSRDCVLDVVNRHSKELASHVRDSLVVELVELTGRKDRSEVRRVPGNMVPTGSYRMVFRGFGRDEMRDVEKFLVVFGGYNGIQAIPMAGRHSEYWYDSEATSAQLTGNLRRTLDRLDLRGLVSFAGTEFQVVKTRSRRSLRVDARDFE